MKQFLARAAGLAMVAGAVYVARVALPARYPGFFKATGVAVLITRSDIDRLVTVYGIIGAVGGAGLVLMVVGIGRRGR